MPLYRIIDSNQRERGPFDAERIGQRVAEGRSDSQTRVQIEGSTDWVLLADIPELAEFLKKPVSSSVPAMPKTTPEPDQKPTALTRKQCPVCRSLNTGDERTGWKGMLNTQVFRSRVCYQCGTVWRPGCSRWLAIPLIAAGIGLPICLPLISSAVDDRLRQLKAAIPGGMTAAPEPAHYSWLMILTGGAFGAKVVILGVNIFRGRSGRLEILKKDESPPL